MPSSSTGSEAVANESGVGEAVPAGVDTLKCLARDVDDDDDLLEEGVPLRLGDRGEAWGEGEVAKASLDPLAPELTKEEGRLEESVASPPVLAEALVELLLAEDLGAESCEPVCLTKLKIGEPGKGSQQCRKSYLIKSYYLDYIMVNT